MLAQLGQEIQLRRESLGYTQQDIAEYLGVSDTTIRNIEKGKPGVAIGHWYKITELLGLSITITPKKMNHETGNSI